MGLVKSTDHFFFPPNEVVDILLILDECHRNHRRAACVYAQQYPDRQHLAYRQIRNIEIRSRRNPFHRQRQRNRLQNNNNSRVLTILGLIHINSHISIRQAEHQIGIPKSYYSSIITIGSISFLSHNSCARN